MGVAGVYFRPARQPRMMSHTKVNYEETETRYGMHFLREPLDCENHGVTVVDAEPGWEGPEHEHGERDHEEVYLLVEGDATITVEGEELALEAGDAVRVAPGATRQVTNGDIQSQFVITGAP
jgi:mannose-6-phosphate isomerase-like protein (cupin superfamily)